MAQIPLGQFEQARGVPRPESRRLDMSASNRAGQGAAAIGEALQGVGQTLAGVATQRRAEETQQREALARAKAANALQEYNLQVAAAVADVDDQLSRGADYSKAGDMYDEQIGKIEPPSIPDLPPEALESYQGAVSNGRMSGRLRVDGLVVTARRDDGQRQFGTALDLAGKTAGLPGADVGAVNAQLRASEQFYIEGFGLDKSATSKAIQDRIDANWTNQAVQRFNDGHNDIGALQNLLQEVTAEDGFYSDKLDAEKRNIVAARVGSRIDALQAKAERAADKADNIAERALSAIDEQVASGVPATLEQWNGWSEVFRSASPELRQEFTARIGDERETQAFLRQPIADQLAGLQRRQAELYTVGGDKRTRANVARLQTAVEANVRMLSETPLQFAKAREGTEIEPLDFSMLSDPAGAGILSRQLQRRANVISDMRKRYGPQVQNRVLLPQEAQMMVATLEKLGPESKAEVFGAMRRMAGSMGTYSAIMAQIQPDAPVTAVAGSLHAQQGEVTVTAGGWFSDEKRLSGAKVAHTLLIGEALLNPSKGAKASDGKASPFPMPPPKQFEQVFSDAVGAAFRGNPQAHAMSLQAVRAYYAGTASQSGDVSGEIDEGRVREAINAVMGPPVNMNGAKVFPPWGMSEDVFKSTLRFAFDTVAPTLGNASRDLDDYTLQQAGDGAYYLIASDGTFLHSNGEPLILRAR